MEDSLLNLGRRVVVDSLLARSGNDNPRRLYMYKIKYNVLLKRTPLKILTGAK